MYTFADRFLDTVDDLWQGVRAWTKSDHTAYYPIASAHGAKTFALFDGSIMSVIRINGYMGQFFRDQHKDLVQNWSYFMRNLAKDSTSNGLALYWSYEYDPDGMKERAGSLRAGMAAAAKRRGVDISDLLEEEAKLYGEICATETQLLLVVTNINAIAKAGHKDAKKEAMARRSEYRKGDDAMLYGMAIPQLEAVHEQHVSKIEHQLNRAGHGYSYERLDVYEGARAMRMSFDPTTTGPGWKARMTSADTGFRAQDGVKVSTQRWQDGSDTPSDYSIIMPPPLSRQMLSDNVTDLGRFCVVNNRIYAPLFVRELATNPIPLEYLIQHFYSARLPLRLVYYMSPDGANANYANRLLASIFTTFSQSNRQIHKADQAMKAYADADGAPYAYSLAATTWAELDVSYTDSGEALYNTKQIQARVRDLETYLQSWGGQQLEGFFGCGVEAAMAASPGYLHPTAAPCAPQIEHDIAMQLPLTRPASVWTPQIAIWLRTGDGVLAPYRPFSSMQSSMITLVTGSMGYGKSNLISEHICFFATHPEAKETPYIRGIDFGASSSGVMDMLRSQLPPNRRHEVDFRTFSTDGTMVKNLLDTRPGCRYPLEDHNQFLINWLTIVCADLVAEAGAGNLGNIFRAILRRAYESCDPRNSNMYDNQPFSYVDAPRVVREAVDQYEYEYDVHTTHWDVVDFLLEQAMERGGDPDLMYAARVAQRFAVPDFAKLIDVSSQLADQFANMPMVSGQPMMTVLTSQLVNANAAFPCFRGQTNIDVSESRATVFDVSEAFGRSSSRYAEWQRSVYFTVVMRLLTEDLFVNLQLSGQELTEKRRFLGLSDAVLDWHLKFLELQDQSMKVFWADEVHRVSGIEGSHELFTSMALEGRKYAVGLLLGSQRPDAFPKALVDEFTTFFAFGAGQSPATADNLQRIFDLADDERDAVLAITPPTARTGAMALCVYKTRAGLQKQILHFQMGGLKRWAYATEAPERALRRQMYEALPTTQQARTVLAKHCPDLKKLMAEREAKNPGVSQDDVIREIAAELIELARA